MLKVLFIPVSGPKGVGEYIRSLTIAQKIKEEIPSSDIKFILNNNVNYLNDVPFQFHPIDGTPTLNVEVVKKIISDEKPDLCIFDSGGRTSLFKFIKNKNIPIIYVSSRNNTRSKAFRFRWLKLINQHWIVQPIFVNGHLSAVENLKIKLTGSHPPIFLETIFPEENNLRATRLKKELGLGNDKYLLFSSGGGGHRGEGEQAPEIFARSAGKIAEKTGLKCIAIMGPNYSGNLPCIPGVITIKAIANYFFIDLLNDAELAVIGGGSSIAQGLALKKICITAPAASDQEKRIDAASKQQLVIPAKADVDDIRDKVLKVLDDQRLRDSIQSNVNELNLTNGLSQITSLINNVCCHK